MALVCVLAGSCAPASLVECVSVPSRAMGRAHPAVVVLPRAYEEEPGARFPVLYLLHGAQGDHWSWVKATPLAAFVAERRLIVVCPNGRPCGWYLDSPRVEGSKVETHIVDELIPYIDSHYRTVARREGRFVAGYSMGGHGALTLAAKHPGLFASASSLSGILDLARWPRCWGIARVLGPLDANRELWRASSAMGRSESFAREARDVRLMIDCGFDDIAYPENLEFHRLLDSLEVRHVYRERPGRHDWRYWSANLEEHIDFHLSARSPGTLQGGQLDGPPAGR